MSNPEKQGSPKALENAFSEKDDDPNPTTVMSNPEEQGSVLALENAFSEKAVRMGFIRKVYGILMVQMTITTTFITVTTFEPNVKLFFRSNPELFWISFAVSIVLLFVLLYFRSVSKAFPVNLIFLFLFTIFESILVSAAVSYYDTQSVMLALGICTVVCLGLTLFAFQTTIDFTACSGVLFVLLIILICFGVICIFIPNKIMMLLHASAGALIFSLFLIYDTQKVIGGRHKHVLSPEEYIFAALSIYLDIINIFLNILQIIALGGDGDGE